MRPINRKVALTMLAIVVTAVTASAQWRIGATAGYVNNSLDTKTNYAYDLRYEDRGGFTMAVPVQYDFTEWLGARAEIAYVQKNYSQHRTHYFEGYYENRRNEYLSLPVMASFSFGSPRLRGFLNMGVYMGCWINSHRDGVTKIEDEPTDADMEPVTSLTPENTYKYSETVEFDSRRDNRFDGGLCGGVGVEFRLNTFVGFNAEWRLYYGLSNMYKSKTVGMPRYNTSWALQVGAFITFDTKKKDKK